MPSLLSGGPMQVLRYLGRYTHRVAISNPRLLACEKERVTFRWKDSGNNALASRQTKQNDIKRKPKQRGGSRPSYARKFCPQHPDTCSTKNDAAPYSICSPVRGAFWSQNFPAISTRPKLRFAKTWRFCTLR